MSIVEFAVRYTGSYTRVFCCFCCFILSCGSWEILCRISIICTQTSEKVSHMPSWTQSLIHLFITILIIMYYCLNLLLGFAIFAQKNSRNKELPFVKFIACKNFVLHNILKTWKLTKSRVYLTKLIWQGVKTSNTCN